MNNILKITLLLFTACVLGCSENYRANVSASDILGNPNYLAFSYGGYRHNTRDLVPTVDDIKEDLKILSAMGVKILRTYNTQHYDQALNLLKAIKQLKIEDSNFEMYVMLGTWIECENANTENPNHNAGNIENNTAEIDAAIEMANAYPDIVKIIAVGNEAMVQWAVKYFVYPDIILKWVNYLQELKRSGKLPSDIWITSSDNFESWGGGLKSYHTEELADLISAVDYVSLHTYPFHDTHYNPTFWGTPIEEENLSDIEKIETAILRAKNYAILQYQNTANYIAELGIDKPIHIGEIGWASTANTAYGNTGSKAADEYKQKLFYEHIRDWTNNTGMSCFYFEAFDEQWKDKGNPLGSENHFGLINSKGEAKYALWDLVDQGVFEGLTRMGFPITKTYKGDRSILMSDVHVPPLVSEMGLLEINTINTKYETGQQIKEDKYIVVHELLNLNQSLSSTFPSAKLKLNPWEGTCSVELTADKTVKVVTGIGNWWGCGLEIQAEGRGENLSKFINGTLNFEIKGTTKSSFTIGFQTGSFAKGNQVNNYITFGNDEPYKLKESWTSFSIPIPELSQEKMMLNVTSLLFLRGISDLDGKEIYLKNIYYSQK